METRTSTRGRSLSVALLAALLASAVSLAAAQAASAAPQLLAPGIGKTLARGSQPLFKARDTDPNARRYRVFMTISRSKKLDKDGDLKQTRGSGTFTSMRQSGRYGFTYKPPAYSFPEWFMQAPGTYYWQAYHIDCRVKGCHVHSKVRSFKVA
ncbi:hypothetical protein [Conexibacter sp. CPCC 206217]|uniref:hypothetical protein n=1 Tax=Conexibacter sp. CPCC 206217 TaxID=3064574 RepID=UPI0027214CB8|nr:hypothetical protein [Conexibacter sp. CPCC 206217]MDO8209445.1 hypothetical protein [Conexibacter sp. CPCC 206217]